MWTTDFNGTSTGDKWRYISFFLIFIWESKDCQVLTLLSWFDSEEGTFTDTLSIRFFFSQNTTCYVTPCPSPSVSCIQHWHPMLLSFFLFQEVQTHLSQVLVMDFNHMKLVGDPPVSIACLQYPHYPECSSNQVWKMDGWMILITEFATLFHSAQPILWWD